MVGEISESARENYRFQTVIVAVGVFLMVIKFIAYYATGSVAILTDAMESIVNVIAGFIGLFALVLSARPPDKDHPYGHGRAEVISATIEGTMITVAGILIIFEAVNKILHPEKISDLDIGILLVAFAALVNYAMGRMAIRKGRKNRSPALEASGKHLCTDTYSSIGIIIGLTVVFAAMKLGFDVWWMDPAMALLFGGLIIFTGFRVVIDSLNGIMDKADQAVLEEIVRCLNENRSPKWVDVHNLRVIKYGSTMHIDMHVTLPFYMTLREEEKEKRKIMSAVRSQFGRSVDLTLSPEPCMGINCSHCQNFCPERKEEFIALIEWNVEMLIRGHQLYGGFNVHFDRDIDTGR